MDELPRPDPAMGVFETMLARDGRVQGLGLHLQRLAHATATLYGAALPEDLRLRVGSAASAVTTPHRLRVDAIPEPTGLAIEITTVPADTGGPRDAPVILKPVLVTGGIGPHKYRDRRLLDALYDERAVPLILDAGDELLEAGSMNVWIIERGTISTPPADGRLLPGVTRALLLELAPQLDLEPRTEPITLARARAADTIFVTSSIRRASAATLFDGSGPVPRTAIVTTIREALDGAAWS